MRRLSGFSLMEMLTVLLIVSIVAAASAPMINKRMMVENANPGGCVWEEVNNGIAYNLDGNENESVIIGSDNIFDNIHSRLHIASDDADSPQITLSDNSRNPVTNARLFYRNGGFGWTTSNNALGAGAVAIGDNASASNINSIAIGNAKATNTQAIAIGNNASASNNSIAIGNAEATNTRAIAIGETSKASGSDSVAIGYSANANAMNSISIKGKSEGMYSINIGDQTHDHKANYAIAIGYNATAGSQYNDNDEYNTAIGYKAKASYQNSIALGKNTTSGALSSIAIGEFATAGGPNSIAIGSNAKVNDGCQNSIAIGNDVTIQRGNVIKLGGLEHTVYIPGDLVVQGNVVLASDFNDDKDSSEPKRVYVKGNNGKLVKIAPSGSDSEKQVTMNDTTQHTFYGTHSSDRRLKNVGKAFTGGLAELKKLDLFHYTYKKDKTKTPRVGVMAQDLQKVFPDAVTKGEDGFLRIRMEDMFYALVNAVKELANMFDRQDDRIVQLEKENKQLQKTVSDLEKQNNEILKRLAKLEKQK